MFSSFPNWKKVHTPSYKKKKKKKKTTTKNKKKNKKKKQKKKKNNNTYLVGDIYSENMPIQIHGKFYLKKLTFSDKKQI